MKLTSPTVTAEWLRSHLGSDGLRVIDATWVPPFLTDRPDGRSQYMARHIPGASYFDIDEIADQNSVLKHTLPPEAVFAAKVGALGISNETHVVAYDSNGFFASARVWWMFRVMGHDQVSVLDGGLSAWLAQNGDVSDVSPDPIAARFEARFQSDLFRSQADMQTEIASETTAVLDARARDRFDGTAPEPRKDLPSGHMPGSVCIPVSSVIGADGRLKDDNDLRALFADHTQHPVVTSCGSGVSAAVLSLALARVGNWDAAVYDGSWSEWAANPENPIQTTS